MLGIANYGKNPGDAIERKLVWFHVSVVNVHAICVKNLSIQPWKEGSTAKRHWIHNRVQI